MILHREMFWRNVSLMHRVIYLDKMSEKGAVFISIAQRCAAQGQNSRATVTIINALRNNPHYIDKYPEATELLAEVLEPGFEEEVHRLEISHPSFGKKLFDALEAIGRHEFAVKLEQSFDDYCIEQMKAVHESQVESWDRWQSEDRMQSQVSGDFEIVDPEWQFVPETANSELNYQKPAGTEVCAGGEEEYSEFQTSRSFEWMVEAARVDSQRNIRDIARKDFRKEENCDPEIVRRFDRVHKTREYVPETEVYSDKAIDRVIIDFDDSVKETPKSAMFAAGQLKIRSYSEEIAAFRERESQNANQPRLPQIVNDPMERVAETTYVLSDSPSVEPYAARHPLRFHLSPQVVVTCVGLCILLMSGWIVWKNITPSIEQKAVEDVTQAYLSAAESNTQVAPSIDPAVQTIVDEQWLKSYQLFLDVWQETHFAEHPDFSIDPDSEDFPKDQSAAQAAYMTWLIFNKETETARKYLDKMPSKLWREHPYFRLWCEALLDETNRDFNSAVVKYEQLMRTPLSPFALTQLGMIALEPVQSQNDIGERFLRAYAQTETPPLLSTCLYDTLTRGKNSQNNPQNATNSSLAAPYRAYCLMADLFNQMAQQNPPDNGTVAELKEMTPLERGEYYRYEAIVSAELSLHHVVEAVDFYRTMTLPEGHPVRQKLLDCIFNQAMHDGDWTGLYSLYPDLPPHIGLFSAARIIDQVKTGASVKDISLSHPESLVKYGVARPMSESVGMDEAYALARDGDYEQALSMTRTLLLARPESWEPLLLQAEILAHSGRGEEAANILEQFMNSDRNAAALFVLADLYRVREGLTPNPHAYLLPWMSFKDAVLESARCEILAVTGWDQDAKKCMQGLDKKDLTRSAWFILNKNRQADSKQWLKAGAENMSHPGYFLALARVLVKEDQLKSASQAYSSALLNDKSTSTPEIVYELEQIYVSRKRRYEGTKVFEAMIEKAEDSIRNPEVLGAMHLAAARLYQPQNAHPMARRHLSRALELLGDREEILQGLVDYYEAKDKPDHARTWRQRLTRAKNAGNN